MHSVPSYKEWSYKEQLVEVPESKEQWLVEFEALKEHLSSSTIKKFLTSRDYWAHQELIERQF